MIQILCQCKTLAKLLEGSGQNVEAILQKTKGVFNFELQFQFNGGPEKFFRKQKR